MGSLVKVASSAEEFLSNNRIHNKEVSVDSYMGIYFKDFSEVEFRKILCEITKAKIKNEALFFLAFNLDRNIKHYNKLEEILSFNLGKRSWILHSADKDIESEMFKLIRKFICLPGDKKSLWSLGKSTLEANEGSFVFDFKNTIFKLP
jgi:hypothetical protein